MNRPITNQKGAKGNASLMGQQCVVCEEPLEYALRGERYIQLSCSHVCHGECFCQFMEDTASECCPICAPDVAINFRRGESLDSSGAGVPSSQMPEQEARCERLSQSTVVWDDER